MTTHICDYCNELEGKFQIGKKWCCCKHWQSCPSMRDKKRISCSIETKRKISEKLRTPFEKIKMFVEKEKYILLSKEEKYKNNSSKIKLRCPEGHEIYMFFDNFRSGYRCKECYYNKRKEICNTKEYKKMLTNRSKLLFDNVRELFEKEKYILLSKEADYKSNSSKLTMECPRGHKFKMSLASFKSGHRCLKCYYENKKGSKLSNETKKKISTAHKGIKKSEETKKKMRVPFNFIKETIENEGYKLLSNENDYKYCYTKLKLICNKGHKIEMSLESFKSGHRCKKCYFEKRKGICLSVKHRENISKSLKRRNFSKEHKKKLRIATIKNIESRCGQIYPNYNPEACKLIDKYGKENGYNFQHAENGGEYHIEELGYWVDGYDKEKNVVIEIDEKYHFNENGKILERDSKRQKEIVEFLGCKFIRLRI